MAGSLNDVGNDIESFSTLRSEGFLQTFIRRRLKLLSVVTVGSVIFTLSLYRSVSDDPRWAKAKDSFWAPASHHHHRPESDPYLEAVHTALKNLELAPDDPRPEDLPEAERFFPDIDTDSLPPPTYEPFPMEQYGILYPIPSREPEPIPPPTNLPLPEGSFVSTWRSPKWFQTDGQGTKDLPRVQYDFGSVKETAEERSLREGRKEAVKRAFVYAWQKYKDNAWGNDEVRPVSGVASNPFQNWGASIIDSLETLLIMGLTEEYNLCRKHINMVDFRLVNGRDWAYGYRSSPEVMEDLDAPEWTKQNQKAGREAHAHIASFEMGIRYLGGLIGAYDLSGDSLLLERAKELARILGKGFDTPSGLVLGRFDAGSEHDWYNSGRVSLAEVGSMTLEMTRLSQLTGDRWYFDRVQRAIDYLEEVVVPRSTMTPLLPLFFDSQIERTNLQVQGEFGYGAMADSYYEYLIKQHQLVGGATDQYKDMYEAAMDKAEDSLYMDIDVISNRSYMIIGVISHEVRQMKLEHLTCFAGAMLGLGARLLGRAKDLIYGAQVTQTCYWAGASTATGLQPEIIHFYGADDPWAWMNVTVPLGIYDEQGSESLLVKEVLRGVPPGAKSGDRRYLGRPETAESVFYMYRLTGDKKWQDKGWRMFTSWVDSCTAGAGFSSVGDVSHNPPHLTDNMESFVFAETFKYYYLLQAEPDLISLDDYVFTTEAHPILLRNRAPGVDNLWSGPGATDEDLGQRAFGTDAQLWERYKLIQQEQERIERLKHKSNPGGHGMGGGNY